MTAARKVSAAKELIRNKRKTDNNFDVCEYAYLS